MSKTSQNAQYHVERECTHQCKSKVHAAECVAAATKRGVSDHQLASYLFNLCGTFAKKQDKIGRSVLHIGASCGKLELCQWLVKCVGSNIDLKDYESGYTALHRALYYGHVDVAVRLIQFGANMGICDNEDMTIFDMLSKERSLSDSLSLSMQCQAYAWGVNKNFSLGTGSDKTRKTPELLEFTKQSVSIIKVALEELHSVYISSCGKVWSCGMGQGGRLGTGSNKSSLTPQLVKTQAKCLEAAVGINHTLLLLENHVVLSFGINADHQLGIHPWVESSLSPRQVCQSNFSSTKPITGISAAKYHSVFYNSSSIWTCGLNGGQLGRQDQLGNTALSSPHHITKPKKVSTLNLNDRQICHVSASVGATVFALNNGDVYYLNKFQCRKIPSKHLDIVKVMAYGGSLECEGLNEPQVELRILILNSRGFILLWKEGAQNTARCIFGTKQCINVNDFYLTQNHLLLVTKDGSAFQGTITTQPQVQTLTTSEKPLSGGGSKSNQFHKFFLRSECYTVKLKRFANIFRAITITADPRGNNYAVIQTHPKSALTDLPVIGESEMSMQMTQLLQEASDFDTIHDATFNVSGREFFVHCYILSNYSSLLAEEAFREKKVVLRDINPYIFEQVLLFLYSGTCQLLQLGSFDTKKIGKKEDPIKLTLELCNKYKIQTLSKKIQMLKYEPGRIFMKDDSNTIPVGEKIEFDCNAETKMYDVTIKSEDGEAIRCHKCILVARLEYFHSMFMGGWSETSKNCVLSLPFKHRVVKDLINFIYTDKLPSELSPEDDLDHIIRLLIVGDQLLVQKLKECCELLLIDALTLRNAPTILHLASIYNTPQLKASTIQFISLNLASFLQSRLLEPLDDTILKDLSDYYRNFTGKKYRVLTPFPESPLDEEIISVPPIPWQENFSSGEKNNLISELLKSPPSISKKKKTPKKSSTPNESTNTIVDVQEQINHLSDEISPMKLDETPEKTEMPLSPLQPEDYSTPPKFESDSIWNSSQFPSLDSAPRTKVLHPPKLESRTRLFGPPTKLSQKERKRLSSESEKLKQENVLSTSPPVKPFKTWATLPPLPSHSSATPHETNESVPDDCNFTTIIACDKEKRANLAKMKSKSFHLTQIEDKAIDELHQFYNVANEFDERITIERIYNQNIDTPQWITSNKI